MVYTIWAAAQEPLTLATGKGPGIRLPLTRSPVWCYFDVVGPFETRAELPVRVNLFRYLKHDSGNA